MRPTAFGLVAVSVAVNEADAAPGLSEQGHDKPDHDSHEAVQVLPVERPSHMFADCE